MDVTLKYDNYACYESVCVFKEQPLWMLAWWFMETADFCASTVLKTKEAVNVRVSMMCFRHRDEVLHVQGLL